MRFRNARDSISSLKDWLTAQTVELGAGYTIWHLNKAYGKPFWAGFQTNTYIVDFWYWYLFLSLSSRSRLLVRLQVSVWIP